LKYDLPMMPAPSGITDSDYEIWRFKQVTVNTISKTKFIPYDVAHELTAGIYLPDDVWVVSELHLQS
jgi:hypothetical protein